jgi:hypothetical protein
MQRIDMLADTVILPQRFAFTHNASYRLCADFRMSMRKGGSAFAENFKWQSYDGRSNDCQRD